jgi:hypothetical protein
MQQKIAGEQIWLHLGSPPDAGDYTVEPRAFNRFVPFLSKLPVSHPNKFCSRDKFIQFLGYSQEEEGPLLLLKSAQPKHQKVAIGQAKLSPFCIADGTQSHSIDACNAIKDSLRANPPREEIA